MQLAEEKLHQPEFIFLRAKEKYWSITKNYHITSADK
jgi:hypothetical protein